MVDGAGLENRNTGNGIGGSNPFPSAISFYLVSVCLVSVRRDGRVAEGARLESVYRLIPYRGFESPSLRHFLTFESTWGFEPVRPDGRTGNAVNPPLSALVLTSEFPGGSYSSPFSPSSLFKL